MNLCGICCCCKSKDENLESQLPDSRRNSDINNKSPRATNITRPDIFVDPNDRNKPIFVIKPDSNLSHDKSIIQQPIIQEPIKQQPITEQPIIQQPIIQEPITQQPITQQPIIQQPIIPQPIEQHAVIQQPFEQQSIIQQTNVEQPTKNNTYFSSINNESILNVSRNITINNSRVGNTSGGCKIEIITYENGREVKKLIQLHNSNGSSGQHINLNIQRGGITINGGIENEGFELNEISDDEEIEEPPKPILEKRQKYENIFKNTNNQDQIDNNRKEYEVLKEAESLEQQTLKKFEELEKHNLKRQGSLEKEFQRLFLQAFGDKIEEFNKSKNKNVQTSDFVQKNQKVDIKPPINNIPSYAATVDNIKNIRLSCLELHNRFRYKHGCPPLKENDKLNKLAEDWANYLMKNNKLENDTSTEDYGQNIYSITSFNAHVTMAVQYWYDEIKNYNFSNPDPTEMSQRAGNFCQLIWKDTVQLGTGVAKVGDKMIVVCFYYPPGNYRDQFNNYMIPPLVNEDRLTNTMIKQQIEEIRESSLRIHNRLRTLHGCPPLRRSIELDEIAEEKIDYIEANNGKLPPKSSSENYLENSLESSQPFYHINGAVLFWYDLGFKEYNYDGKENTNRIYRCFTAMIWRDSIYLGTAVRRIGNDIRFICVYSPAMIENHMYKDYLIPRPITDKLYLPLDDYPDEMRWSSLKAHNILRHLHGCPPLISNPKLDKCAEEWAQHLAMTKQFYHRPNNKYGENLYWTSDKYGHVTLAVQDWYDEINLYDYEAPGFSKATGHFTQLIWKDCLELGTGIARGHGRLYVVCVYDPPGNYKDRFNDYYKNKNLKLESRPSNAIKSNRLRLSSTSNGITVNVHPTEPKNENPIFINRPDTTTTTIISEQPKSTSKIETNEDKNNYESKVKEQMIKNLERTLDCTEIKYNNNTNKTVINESPEINYLDKLYAGCDNFAYVDEIDSGSIDNKSNTIINQKIRNKQINNDDVNTNTSSIKKINIVNIECSVNTYSEENDCTCQIITTVENGKEIKTKIENSTSCEKCGIQNDGFKIDEINKSENGEITPPLEKEPNFDERRKLMIEKSLDKFFENFNTKLQSTSKTHVPDEVDAIIDSSKSEENSKPVVPSNIENIRLSCLELHNRLRAQHGCPPLKQSKVLNQLAEDWAHNLIKNNCKLLHRPNNKYGENLYWTNSRNAHVTMAVYTWYDEVKSYDFNNPDFSKDTGHFTQLIWRDTIELGTAVVVRGSDMIVVCNYNPPGNYSGEFNDYTVPQLTAEEQLTNDMIEHYIENIRESSLITHNRLRALHGCPPLQKSNELDTIAERMLEHVERTGKVPKFRKNQDMAVSSTTSNIAFMHVTNAIQSWYDEGALTYDYNEQEENDSGGFIQLIWRDTLLLGTAMRRIDEEIWILCVYSPSRLPNHMYNEYLIPRPVTDRLHKPLEMYPKELRQSSLTAHNRFRSLHNCPPLVQNPELDKLAEEWAKHLAEINKLYHRPNSKYGENLYWTSDKYGHVTMAVQSWYDEMKFYDFSNPNFSSETGHFTQLIWKDSIELGTGISRRGDSLYVVCLYNPPGNYVGRFNEYYVPRPIEF
ncbi:uncharacterized protein LOC129610872 [Condylostylus longicornis]|uniref:uncharacterized protein LOC129610872 n=1 Tax=Condylostylus longicornis TaxID=2530218 RepID=UPI00244DF9D3|nr:uncharacterized protein LOC129610872 [Condylostylus longicornis]